MPCVMSQSCLKTSTSGSAGFNAFKYVGTGRFVILQGMSIFALYLLDLLAKIAPAGALGDRCLSPH